MLFVRVVVVNALAQGALQLVIQLLWIEHTTFQLGGGHSTTELISTHAPVVGELTPVLDTLAHL